MDDQTANTSNVWFEQMGMAPALNPNSEWLLIASEWHITHLWFPCGSGMSEFNAQAAVARPARRFLATWGGDSRPRTVRLTSRPPFWVLVLVSVRFARHVKIWELRFEGFSKNT